MNFTTPERTPSLFDYDPFGMTLEGRNWSVGSDYRYGLNGQSVDEEICDCESFYHAKFWEYDSRIGRRWNIDPVSLPSDSRYSTFYNNPIFFSDPQGDCPLCDWLKWSQTVNPYGYITYETIHGTYKTLKAVGNVGVIWAQNLRNGITNDGATTLGLTPSGNHSIVTLNGNVYDMSDPVQENALWDDVIEPSGKEIGKQILLAGAGAVGGVVVEGVVIGGKYAIKQGMSLLEKKGLRLTLANDFYAKSGGKYLDIETRMSHLGAINPEKPVFTKTYKKGETLIQWRKPGQTTGDYYTLPGEDPSTLGIPTDYTEAYEVVLDKNYKVLQSTAADANWSGTMMEGGGIQIFNTEIKTSKSTITLIQQ